MRSFTYWPSKAVATVRMIGAVLAVVDLDGFKTINDTHGHHAGDICIRHVADVIGRSVREGDWLARRGGGGSPD